MTVGAYLCRYDLQLRDTAFRVHFHVEATHTIFVTIAIVMLNFFEMKEHKNIKLYINLCQSEKWVHLACRCARGRSLAGRLAAIQDVESTLNFKCPHFLMRTIRAARKLATERKKS